MDEMKEEIKSVAVCLKFYKGLNVKTAHKKKDAIKSHVDSAGVIAGKKSVISLAVKLYSIVASEKLDKFAKYQTAIVNKLSEKHEKLVAKYGKVVEKKKAMAQKEKDAKKTSSKKASSVKKSSSVKKAAAAKKSSSVKKAAAATKSSSVKKASSTKKKTSSVKKASSTKKKAPFSYSLFGGYNRYATSQEGDNLFFD